MHLFFFSYWFLPFLFWLPYPNLSFPSIHFPIHPLHPDQSSDQSQRFLSAHVQMSHSQQMHPVRGDWARVQEAECQRAQAIGGPWRGNEINMAKLEKDLLSFLLPQTSPPQTHHLHKPPVLCFVLVDPASFSVLNNSLLKCKYLVGVVKPYQLMVDCEMNTRSCFNRAQDSRGTGP